MTQKHPSRWTTDNPSVTKLLRMMKLTTILLFACSMIAHAGGIGAPRTADVRTVTGTVTSLAGEPLSGVTVQVPGKNTTTTTDANGVFSIVVDDNATTLRMSFVGMVSQDVDIAGKTSVTVILVGSDKALDEVVVV